MATSDPWPIIHEARGALAADLEGLTDEQWGTPSLCAGWTVRDVLDHMTATAYPPEGLMRAADFSKGSNLLLRTKNRIAGLSLRATDVQWSHGSGPEVSGPMLDLLMAMTGRRAGLAALSGPGLATLQSRM